MSDEAATPTGGAEVSARPDASAKPSVHDRLKAALFAPQEPEPDHERPTPQDRAEPAEPKAPQEPQKAEAPKEQETAPDEGAQQEEQQEQNFESFDELAEALGWDVDKLYSLSAKTKIDGKEGKATLKDFLKSYQLEGHLNQKLMTHAEEKKAFETERQNFVQTSQHKMQQLDAGVQVLTKMLQSEFAEVNWQQLQNEDPVTFAQKFAGFQQRQAQLNHFADLIGNERKASEAQTAQQQQAYLAEQAKFMEAKIPEWNDASKRDKELDELIPLVKDAYGITEQEVRGLRDHREILVLRDAWKWQQLQKQKPAIVNKVKAAPKLLRPGTQQSRAAQDGLQLTKDRERLRQSGKVSDAKHVLKKLIFN